MRASPVPSVVRGSFFVKFSSSLQESAGLVFSAGWIANPSSDSSYGNVLKNKVGRLCSQPQLFTASLPSYSRTSLELHSRAAVCLFGEPSVTVMSSNWEKAFSATPPGCEGAAWKRIVIHLEALPDEGAAKLEFTVRGRRDMSARRRREYTHTPRAPSSTHARQSTQIPTLPHRASMHRRWENTWRRTG